ncbi:regulatory protein RecX [Tahibacter amnicola]|uniref:Regulatory protein RecX n=1 Tax=Tahibacter amnicola TaxID=2976241 RepID=A0ABY6BIM1_9GAMM|nr:regulatory protein RecX [Tahibacter amnicola]UXI69609.1 recombination regulator RecX [Tahibacter amnicola]
MRRRSDDDKPLPSAYQKALGLLTRREHSARELSRKLGQTGYSAEEAGEAVSRLQSQSFQSDTRFVESLIRTRAGQGYGPRRVLAELRTHSVGDEIARQAIAESGVDWADLAQRQYRRRYGSRAAGDRAETARRAAFLLRRGFDAATVRAITHADDVDDSADEFD